MEKMMPIFVPSVTLLGGRIERRFKNAFQIFPLKSTPAKDSYKDQIYSNP